MKPTLRSLLPTVFLAFSAQADWLVSTYPTVASDSAQTRAIYGIQTYQNKSSAVTASVPGGYVQLDASKIASDGTEGYTVDFGVQQPITPDWKTYDLTGLQSITFEYQNATKITDVLSVSFGSEVYSDAIVKAGTVYSNDLSGSAALAAGTTWKNAEVLLMDFATPTWWTEIPVDYPTIDQVLKRVRNIQFSPKSLYTSSGTYNGAACMKCVGPTMTSQTLKIRNIRLVGIDTLVPVPSRAAFRQTRSFSDLTVSVGDPKLGYRLADYFIGATGYSARDLGPVRNVGTTTTTDSLYLDLSGMVTGGLKDMIEVRADSGTKSLRDTFVVTSSSPILNEVGYLLSSYATVASDSTRANSIYGIESFQNKSSSVTTSVPGGYVQLQASTIASDGTVGYSANIGLLHPLTSDWAVHDLTGLTAITFEYQNDGKITDVLSVRFGSPTYSDSLSKSGYVYSYDLAGATALAAGTTWKKAELLIYDFATPTWWSDIPADYPTIEKVLKQVKSIEFSPRTLYKSSGTVDGVACSKCVGPTMTSMTMKIRNVRLVGITSLGSIPVVPTKPTIPTLLEPAHGSEGVSTGARLSWAQVAGAQSYLVQVDTSTSFLNPKEVRVSEANSWVSFSLAKNRKYVWRVQAKNSAGSSEWSPIWSFTTGMSDSSALALKSRLARNWRRSGDRLTVFVPQGVQRATLEVRNLEGKVLRIESAIPSSGEASWSIGNLHGTFLAQVRSESGPLESRLLVVP